jgi:hypothetical protein
VFGAAHIGKKEGGAPEIMEGRLKMISHLPLPWYLSLWVIREGAIGVCALEEHHCSDVLKEVYFPSV